MELMDAIKKRRAIRKYKPDAVPQAAIDSILEAARLAPSGVNSQPWKFKVVTDPEVKEKIFLASKNQFHIRLAPAVIIICADTMSYSKSLKVRFKELLDNGVYPGRPEHHRPERSDGRARRSLQEIYTTGCVHTAIAPSTWPDGRETWAWNLHAPLFDKDAIRGFQPAVMDNPVTLMPVKVTRTSRSPGQKRMEEIYFKRFEN
jgi:hypothetical protein